MNTQQTLQLTKIKNYAFQQLHRDTTGHSIDHLERVVCLVKKMAAHYDVDLFIAISAAYLHDVIDDKLFGDPIQQQTNLSNFLRKIGLSSQQIQEIINIITSMSFAHNLEQQSCLNLTGQIVQDADWLDAIGAIGITRAIYFGGAHHEKIYDPAIPVRHNLTRDSYRNLADETILNHFHEKLFLIKDKLNTPYAKQIAAKRHQFMHTFYTEFMAEWNATK